MWTEEICGQRGTEWNPERYVVAARQLGRFQGRYLTGRPLPSNSAVSTESQALGRTVLGVEDARTLEATIGDWDSPAVHRFFGSRQLAVRTRRVLEHRQVILDALAECPPVLNHGDFHAENIFSMPGAGRRSKHSKRGGVEWPAEEQTVAVDWALCGDGPLGQDVACLMHLSALLLALPVDRIRSMEAAALDAYLQGLRTAGWQGDSGLVELSYRGCTALWGLMLIGYCLIFHMKEHEQWAEYLEARFGQNREAILRQWRALLTLAVENGERVLAR